MGRTPLTLLSQGVAAARVKSTRSLASVVFGAFGAFGAFIVLGGLSSACKPAVGGACPKEGREVCASKDAALICHDRAWTTLPCRGPAGCTATGDAVACDTSSSEVGEACNLEGDLACTMDKKAYLQCASRKWIRGGDCMGPAHCQASAKSVRCDSTVARVDTPCAKLHEGNHACSYDSRSALVCRNGKYVVSGLCTGPKGCTVRSDGIDCDDSVTEPGNPCEQSDHFACSRDGRTLLACKDGHFVREEDCKKKTCRMAGGKVGCL